MFCTECGNQLPESADFCPNCGTKTFVTRGAEQKIINNGTNYSQNEMESFKEYVDAHIRKTTKFQSAQELISKSKPWRFMWKIVGICVLIGVILAIIKDVNILTAAFMLGILGIGIAFIATTPLAFKYQQRFSAKINTDSDIDIMNLCEFLTKNLCNIAPSFGEWSLIEERGLVPLITNKIAKIGGEVKIGCEFGAKRKNLAEITIKNKPENRAYYISAGYNGFLLSFRLEDMFTRSCLVKTAPILQAAMEYYINYSTSLSA